MAFSYRVRGRNYEPGTPAPYRISRSKIDLFLQCPRCFYLDQRLGLARPETYPLTLNIAVDELLKREFDILRASKNPHPIMQKYHIDAVPFQHKNLEVWRDALRNGIEYLDPSTNLSVRGGVDDVWVRPDGELLIVDYKATAKRSEITLDGDLGAQYKRQAEVYQWLFRKNGFRVSNTAYFVYVNGKKDAEKFDGKLEFDMSILPCEGDARWVESALPDIKKCLEGAMPAPASECAYCSYRKLTAEAAAGQKKVSGSKKPGLASHENTKQKNIFGESF